MFYTCEGAGWTSRKQGSMPLADADDFALHHQSPVSFQALSDLISQMLPDITKR